MAMDAATIQSLIEQGIPGAEVRISDLRGDGEHYSALVISNAFQGKNRVQQHQMVYQTLKGAMDGQLHALAIQTALPE